MSTPDAPPATVQPGTTLAIDFGSSYTTAALRTGSDAPTVIWLEEGRPVASAVALNELGELVVGLAALSEGTVRPEALEPSPKRQLGRGETKLILAGRPVEVLDAVAAVLELAWTEALRRLNGSRPAVVRLTHPASWTQELASQLEDAARRAGIESEVQLLPEPVAAAMHFVAKRDGQMASGSIVAVYDLGGGTFDVAVLRRQEDGFAVMGHPLGLPDVGGIEMDERLARHVVEQIVEQRPDLAAELAAPSDRKWRRVRRELLRESQSVKELLSRNESVRMHVPDATGFEPISITKPEFEALISTAVERSLDEVDAALLTAGVTPGELSRLYLVGGSSRIPFVEHAVERRFQRADTEDDPQSVVALGAAIADQPVAYTRDVLRPTRNGGVAGTTPPPPLPRDPAGVFRAFVTAVLVDRDLAALDALCTPALEDRDFPEAGGLAAFRARAARLLEVHPRMSAAIASLGEAGGVVTARLVVSIQTGSVTTSAVTSNLRAVIRDGRLVQIGERKPEATDLFARLLERPPPRERNVVKADLMSGVERPIAGALTYDRGSLSFVGPGAAVLVPADDVRAAAAVAPLELDLERRRALLGTDYADWLRYIHSPAIAMAAGRVPPRRRMLAVLREGGGGLSLGMRRKDALPIVEGLRARNRVLGVPLVVEVRGGVP